MKIVKPSFEVKLLCDGKEMLKHIEWCGKTCYKSEANITEDSAYKFIKDRAIDSNHSSMLEHCSVTVKIKCDLGISQEETRHRLIHVDDDVTIDMEWDPAVSQQSTRYCNYSKNKFNKEVTFIDIKDHLKNPLSIDVWMEACRKAEENYLMLINLGESAQIARSLLIRSTATEMTVTANLREWRHWFQLRAVGTTGKPHPQMLEISVPLLEEFKKLIPIIFDDITVRQ